MGNHWLDEVLGALYIGSNCAYQNLDRAANPLQSALRKRRTNAFTFCLVINSIQIPPLELDSIHYMGC